jgi:putative photosynthetic complex assembly protein
MTDLALNQAAPGMPRGVLISAAVLAAITIVSAGTARVTGLGRPDAPKAEAAQTLALRFEDQKDGSVVVRRAGDRAKIYTVAPGTNGFLRATMRGLARERHRIGAGDSTPFVLTAWSDGRMSLDDAATGRTVPLEAFGVTNEGAFAQLFQASGGVR